MSEAELHELGKNIEKYQPAMTSLLTRLIAEHVPLRSGKWVIATEWRPFIQCLSASTPVCGFLHPGARLLSFKNIDATIFCDLEALKTLQEQCPVVFDLIHNLGDVRASVKIILEELLRLAYIPFDNDDNSTKAEHNKLVYTNVDTTGGNCMFFPNLQICRQRGIYNMDSINNKLHRCTKRKFGHEVLATTLL